MESREEWRDPTPEELRILRRILSVDFAGCEEYRSQLVGIKVARDKEDGLTLFLLPTEHAPRATPADSGEITCGTYEDSDRIRVEIFLVTRLGSLRFLDRMKLDPVKEPLILFPPDDRISVRISPPAISTPKPKMQREDGQRHQR